MASFSISLGAADQLTLLYSYPNQPGSSETLANTITHWFNLTLMRDGYAAQGANASVRIDGSDYILDIDGPSGIEEYGNRLVKFLKNGSEALEVVDVLKKPSSKPEQPWPDWLQPPAEDKLWDPQNTGKWRFFLPFGMAMIKQKSLQFFHYPPIRLLDTMRDYLDDPVPVRLIELLQANGVKDEQQAWLYSTVLDGAPIAAPDDQGTIYPPGGYNPNNPAVHLIPISHFHDYQRMQVELLLNTSEVNEEYTVPIIVYGTPARETFGDLYLDGNEVSTSEAITIENIVQGRKTAVLGSGHPYAFYAQVQSEVGDGTIIPQQCSTAVSTMKKDLTVSRWQVCMAGDPTLDPDAVFQECKDYWNSPEQQATICKLVLHQGSLLYPDPNSLKFEYRVSLEQAAKTCSANNNDVCACLK